MNMKMNKNKNKNMNKNINKNINRTPVIGLVLLCVVFFAVQTVFALDAPQLDRRVNDLAGILNVNQVTELETMLLDVENKTSSQVVLLIVPSLEGDALEDFSLRVAEKNKIGQAEFSNGLLVLITMGEKKVRFEVGYGLESIVTDMKSGYIIRQFITAEFKKGNYYEGIYNGLNAVTGLITKDFEITPEQLAKYQKDQKKSKGGHIPVGLIIFIGFIVLSSMRRGGSGMGAVVGSAIISGMGRSSGSGFGGFSGGGGGGGFSGGGGSFGGGGSSGGW